MNKFKYLNKNLKLKTQVLTENKSKAKLMENDNLQWWVHRTFYFTLNWITNTQVEITEIAAANNRTRYVDTGLMVNNFTVCQIYDVRIWLFFYYK